MKLLRKSGEFSQVESPLGCNLLHQGYFLVTMFFLLETTSENSKENFLNFLTKIKFDLAYAVSKGILLKIIDSSCEACTARFSYKYILFNLNLIYK